MILDTMFVMMLVAFLVMGYGYGFTLGFYDMFKWIFIMFFSKLLFNTIIKRPKASLFNQLNFYIILIFLLYLIITIFLFKNSQFLKKIKVDERFNGAAGMLFAGIKMFLVVLIIYVIVVIGGMKSKRVKTLCKESKVIQTVADFAPQYIDLFPKFMKYSIKNYTEEKKEREKIKEVLDYYRKNDKNGNFKF